MSESQGMNTLDMMSMSPAVRRLSRIMLKYPSLTYEQICEKCEELPEEKRPTLEEINEAVNSLIDMKWLHKIEEDGEIIYTVKLKKKEGSAVSRTSSQQRRSSTGAVTMDGLWGKFDEGVEAAGEGEQAQKEMTDFQSEQQRKAGDQEEGKKGFFKKLFGN